MLVFLSQINTIDQIQGKGMADIKSCHTLPAWLGQRILVA